MARMDKKDLETENMEQKEKKIDETAGKRYGRSALLNSKRFAAVQRDFLKAILIKEEYTIEEAEKAVKEAMRREATPWRAETGQSRTK